MKNKKPLLQESTSKRWMKLAGTQHLAENFWKEKEDGEEEMEEVLTQNQNHASGAPDRLDEEEPVVDAAPEAPHAEPDGDEAVSEPMVADLVQAIADAIAAKTGVDVQVDGGAAPEAPVDAAPASDAGAEMPAEEPLMEAEVTSMDNQLGDKKSKPADPGSVKDPEKNKVKVDGAEQAKKGEGISPTKEQAYKALEEKLAKKVLSALISELKKATSVKKKS